MQGPAWEDLGDFLQPESAGGFAKVATIPGKPDGVPGIFDEPYLDAQVGEYRPDILQPRFTAAAADLAGIKRGDRVTIDGTQYAVKSNEPDGTGMATLRLAAGQ